MKTAQEIFEQLNSIDENVRIDAKRASEIDKSIMETVCAFANEPGLGGGYLLLGAVRTGFQNGLPGLNCLFMAFFRKLDVRRTAYFVFNVPHGLAVPDKIKVVHWGIL